LKLKQFLTKNIIRGRSRWSVASDIFFILLIAMLIIPSTRSLLLSGVAKVRTLVTNPVNRAEIREPLTPENWQWNLRNQDGDLFSFDSFKGEVIFLNQWATWCPPCRAEMPDIERLFRDYGSRVRFVMLTGEDPAVAMKFIKEQGYTFPVYYGSAAGAALVSRSIPNTTIINRKGQIIADKKGAYNWNASKIRKLIDHALSIE